MRTSKKVTASRQIGQTGQDGLIPDKFDDTPKEIPQHIFGPTKKDTWWSL